MIFHQKRLATWAGMLVMFSAPALGLAEPAPSPLSPQATEEAKILDRLPPKPAPAEKHPPIDRSGRKEIGRASYYARKFDGRKMADGHRFDPRADVAASKTLPIGTTAKVTNLKTGKSAIVTVEDHGPFVHGRVLDVTPKVADKLEIKKTGVAPVLVKPIAVPEPNGQVKLGAGAAEAAPKEILQAVRKTQEIASRR
jgi:rare lipoprotein A